MKTKREHNKKLIMRKYYQLILILVCFVSVITLLIYRHEYYRLRYVLEVLNFFGKPGLSEIEFCGPGFNATMLTEIVRNSSLELREQPPLFQQIDENFYTYSSFLRSYQKHDKLTPSNAHYIDTIVIGKAETVPNFRCNIWLENLSKPKPGRFSYKLINEQAKGFNLYVFHCSLAQNFGKPTAISFYSNDYTTNPLYAPINKVVEVNTKRKVQETRRIQFINNFTPALCVMPNHLPFVSRDSVIEFLVFHHMMGVNNFVIYDSMISNDFIRRLNLLPKDVTNWNIQFFPLNYPFIYAKSYYILREAIELDCLLRHYRIDSEESNSVSHVAVLSWDEFLVPRIHNTLKNTLEDMDPARKIRTTEIKTELFCLNQVDDDNIEQHYPNIFKKTHYYNIPFEKRTVFIRNLYTMSNYEELFKLNATHLSLSLDILGVHRYTECSDSKSFSAQGYSEKQMEMFQHKFEGAMIKFGKELVENKIYWLYKSGQIWDKHQETRDML